MKTVPVAISFCLLFCSPAWGAEVKKDIGAGKTYTDVTAWEAASYGATGSDDAIGQVYGTVLDTVIINDSTPLSVTLEGEPSGRHDGTTNSGAMIQSDSVDELLTISTDITVQWLELRGNDSYNHTYWMVYCSTTSMTYTFLNNIFWDWNVNNSYIAQSILRLYRGTIIMKNNIVCDSTNAGGGRLFGIHVHANTTAATIINNTVANIHIAGTAAYENNGIAIPSESNIELRNNLVYDITAAAGTAPADYISETNVVHDNNLSEDASSPDSAHRSKTITFAGAGSGDYHLAAGDTDAIGDGTGPSSDADVPTDDIDGDTRAGSTCDIGADEYESVVSVPLFYRLYRNKR